MAGPDGITGVLEALLPHLVASSDRIRWTTERCPQARETVLSVSCRAAGSVAIRDELVEDIALSRRHAANYLIDHARDLLVRCHGPSGDRRLRGAVQLHHCPNCDAFVDLTPTRRMTDEQLSIYSETQALEWMRRAEELGIKLGAGRAPMKDG
jgi:hypothetical protein